MKEISPIGWALIGVIVVLVLSGFWTLVSLLRRKNKNPDGSTWSKSWHALTNPWEKENRQWDQLSKEVSALRQTSGDEDDPAGA